MKCPHCNGEHPNFFRFCPVTGKTISPNRQTADADSGLYHQDEGAAPHLASESGIITGGNSSSSNQEKAKNIESIGIDECCNRLGIRKKYIDFDLEAIELPSEEERQLIDRLRKLIDTDKKEYSDCATIEDYIKYLNHWTDGLWRDAASQNIEKLRAEAEELSYYNKCSKSIFACRTYLKKYPKGQYVRQVTEEKKKLQKKIWYLTGTSLLLASTITFCILFITTLKEKNLDRLTFDILMEISEDSSQETLTAARDSLEESLLELADVHSKLDRVSEAYPMIITDIDIRNISKSGEIQTDYGNTIYDYETMYLQPRISYYGLISEDISLKCKLYNPSGKMTTGTTSPSGYSFSDSKHVWEGTNTMTLSGWGSATKGYYDSGTYRIEIWYNDICLKSKTFTIY